MEYKWSVLLPMCNFEKLRERLFIGGLTLRTNTSTLLLVQRSGEGSASVHPFFSMSFSGRMSQNAAADDSA